VRHEWQARRWDWVDPKADTEANILKVKAGLMAPQDLAAAMGYDFDDVLAGIKAAQDLAAQYGVSLTAYDGLPGANSAQGQQAQAQAQPQAEPMASKAVDGLLRSVELLAKREVPSPVVHNHFTMPEQRHEHHTHIEAPPAPNLNVRNEIAAPEVHAHFEAVMPEVRAEAPMVNVVNQVQPAAVTVVDNHPTRAIQTVERDGDDEITRTVTTYER
jgi:hypothetical protein